MGLQQLFGDMMMLRGLLTSYMRINSLGDRALMASLDMKCSPLKGMLRHRSSWKKRMLPSAMSSGLMPAGRASELPEAEGRSCVPGAGPDPWCSAVGCKSIHTGERDLRSISGCCLLCSLLNSQLL